MTAAADLTPETTVDPSGDAATSAVQPHAGDPSSPDAEATADAPDAVDVSAEPAPASDSSAGARDTLAESSEAETDADERVAEAPTAGEPVADEPTGDEPSADEPVGDQPEAEQPAAEEPAAVEAATDAPLAEKPAADEPVAEEPVAEEPAADQPASEESATDETEAEAPEAEAPVAGAPMAEAPMAEESPVEEPAAEEPAGDAPPADEPARDAPPAGDAPPADEPAGDAPPADEPAGDAPPADEPAGDAPPAGDQPPAEEPRAEEPAAETPVAAEPSDEQPETDESVAEEPSSPEPEPGPRTDAAADKPASAEDAWGRVEEDGTVSVREGEGWRVVGQYPDGSPEEALAYFERKYADLAGEVGLLEVRYRRGGAPASDLRSAARAVNAKLEGAAAVGDLASLVARVAVLTESLAAASQSEALAAREAVDDAVRTRTELVEKVEAIAARDPRTVQWKQASADVSALFDEWQSQQQNGPRLPKSTAQQLWKRFRDARATFDKHRREFYAELDEAHKGVRDRKTRLVERAEALAPKGEDGIPAYRELLDEWKTAGRAGKKVDDALWARFKAAGDALYSARIERESADAAASREKIESKRALIEEAQAVADERDIAKARTLLTAIQRRWDEIGRIFPREAERALDDDLRKVEQGLRTREESDWKRNNPETKARANEMTRQLTEAIEKLEDELAAAQKTGDKAKIAKASEALEARRSWLNALGG
ncbi:DUF349 domain-containing protein [Microbacterium deminutum]|uniref:DUF349 domain-containing protein n=1 Tax=Microbacterium deminutum TaxID=344164 RepID=A0ABP5BR94_9MICO